MLVRRIDQVGQQQMSMPGAEGVRMRLMIGREDGAPTFAMRQFEVEPGGHTPLHRHNYEHEVLIVEGSGRIADSDDGASTREIGAGDVVFIPANQVHQFRNESQKPFKFMCLVPTHFDCGQSAPSPTPGS